MKLMPDGLHLDALSLLRLYAPMCFALLQPVGLYIEVCGRVVVMKLMPDGLHLDAPSLLWRAAR